MTTVRAATVPVTITGPVPPARRRGARLRAAVAAFAVAGTLLAGCSANGGSATSGDQQAEQGSAGGSVQGGADAGAPQAAAAATPGAAASSDANRQVVRNGELYLTVDDPLAAADRVAQVAGRLGGRVDDREQEAGADGQAGSATMTIRVPADSLDDAVKELGGLGDVTRYTEKSQDVTGTVVDLDARISAAQTSVERVQGFLEHASTTTELLNTEQALSQRQTELEQLRGQRAALADQVAMSTLYVSLTAPGHPVIQAPGPRSFAAGIGVGWRSLIAALRGASVVLGVLLPWLVLAAVVAVAVVVPVRRRRRRAPAPAPAVLPAFVPAPVAAPVAAPAAPSGPFLGPLSGPPPQSPAAPPAAPPSAPPAAPPSAPPSAPRP
ncbi:MAG TPA: DUF4349 domain-containing protein [Cellulomonas sp.]